MAGDTRRAFERQFPHDIHNRSDKRRSSHSRLPFHCHRCGDTGPQACGGRFCCFDHGAERASISGRSVQPLADVAEGGFARSGARSRQALAPRLSKCRLRVRRSRECFASPVRSRGTCGGPGRYRSQRSVGRHWSRGRRNTRRCWSSGGLRQLGCKEDILGQPRFPSRAKRP